MAAAVAFVLLVAGCGSSRGYPPARPFTLAEKRALEADLLAAAPGKPDRGTHLRGAAALAVSHGQIGLAAQIAGLMPGGCHAAGYPFHLSSALRMLRESPTAPES